MPITDVPPQAPETEEPRQRKAHRGRASRLGVYDDMGGYDLLHVIEDLEDERARVQLREKIWIALILHILLFTFIYFAPRLFPVTRVREAPLNNKQDLTVLTLPPDALKQLQQAKPAPPAPRTRQAPVPQRRVFHAPAPRPAPPQPRPQPPAPQPPQVAHTQAPPAPQPKPVAPPLQHSQTAQLNAPKPQPNLPNAPNLAQSMREAQRRADSYSGGGAPSASAPPPSAATNGGAQILSDTMGIDFSKYIERVVYDTKRAWYPIIPEVARPPISKQGRVLIRFKILPDGTVHGMTLEGPSGDVSLDRAAWGGILGAQPFPPLPKAFKGPFLELRFYFLYNDTGNQ